MTIHRRVRLALLLMVIVPAALMALAFGIASRLAEASGGADIRWEMAPSWTNQGSTMMGHGPFTGIVRLVFPAFVVILLVCNGLLSWWVSSGIVGPLARLKDSARRIGEGDLGFKIMPSGDDELGEVAVAFETMRTKLSIALERQAAEERARKELVAHVSHDLRTPIAVIRGHAEGLLDGIAATPSMRDRYLGAILDRSRELEALIDLLFDYSRLDLEGANSKSVRLLPGPFLGKLREVFESSFPQARISLCLDPSADGAVVTADPVLLRRVMTNLVENAVKHGGKPVVAISCELRRNRNRVEIVVADDGEGLPEADIGRIFEPFFRGDRARERGGSGLGLAIVRKIMETMGGSVRAAKSDLGGLEIILSFPEAKADGEANPDSRR